VIFAVTRVIFAFGRHRRVHCPHARLAETGGLPGTVGLVAVLAVLPPRWRALRWSGHGANRPAARFPLLSRAAALVPAAAVWLAAGTTFSMRVRIGLSARPGLPIAPLLDRVGLPAIADASVLLLLTVA